MTGVSSSRFRVSRFVLVSMLLAPALTVSTSAIAQTTYGVSVKTAKRPELAKIRTYAWAVGHPAFDKAVDGQIKAAVDRELSARGLTKSAAPPADAEVTYHSLTRTDVDLTAKGTDGRLPSYQVGTLVVDLLEPKSRDVLFRVRIDKPLDADRSKLARTIDEVVTAMFAKYPTADGKK